jgi:UDP-N-acetylglucosamine 4,6-dehydratase/5-epimerase
MFDDKTLLITGGTGSFGNSVLKRFLESPLREVRIFSRDEKKQDDQRKRFQSDKLKFYIGDVREQDSIHAATRGVDFIFHAAALKQVPSCEFHPMEAVRTNVIGTQNVIEAAIANGVSRVICLSTDKAVYPVNAMGISKALMEKVMIAKSRELSGGETVICGTRYGNVLASRGSVVPLFANQIHSNKPLTVTDPSMSRFMMTLTDAVDLVLFAFEHGKNGDIFVQKAPAVTIGVLARSVAKALGRADYPIEVIGTRHGEKNYETLLTQEEMVRADDLGRYFRIRPDLRDLNYAKFIDEGETAISHGSEYNSRNTEQLNVDAMTDMLLSLDLVRDIAAGRNPMPED